jgi:hypothetical protein
MTGRQRGTLPEPIEIAKCWKNRKGEAVIGRLSSYEGHVLVDLRTWYSAADGTLKPAKGLACGIRHLPQLAEAIGKALEKARALDLIGDDTEDGP